MTSVFYVQRRFHIAEQDSHTSILFILIVEWDYNAWQAKSMFSSWAKAKTKWELEQELNEGHVENGEKTITKTMTKEREGDRHD